MKQTTRDMKQIVASYDNKLQRAIDSRDIEAVRYMIETDTHYVTNEMEIIALLVLAEDIKMLDVVLTTKPRSIYYSKYYADLYGSVSYAYNVAKTSAKSSIVKYLDSRFILGNRIAHLFGEPIYANTSTSPTSAMSKVTAKGKITGTGGKKILTATQDLQRSEILTAAHAICGLIPKALRSTYPEDDVEAAVLIAYAQLFSVK